jgi:hypothetical protein
MRSQSDVSRRHVLAISAAAGGLAIGNGLCGASAQAGKRIEQLDANLDKIIDTLTGRNTLGAVNLKMAGLPVPTAKKT